MKSKLQNLILSSMSLLVALYVGEIFLSYWPDSPASEERADRAKELGIEFDNRTKFEVVEDLRAGGEKAYPGIHLWLVTRELNHEVDLYPLSGAANKLTVFGNESGEYITYLSDQYGFNNPGTRWQEPIEVALIGDSFAQGAYVAPEANIAGVLNDAGFPTLNLGIIGAGPLIKLGIVKEYLTELKPKKVVWFYFEGNDLLDLRRESPFALLNKYLLPEFRQDLMRRQSDLNAFQSSYLKRQLEVEREHHERAVARKATQAEQADTELAYRRSLPSLLSLQSIRNLVERAVSNHDNDAEPDQYDIKKFEEILSYASQAVAAWEGEFYFIYLPAWERYGRSILPDMLRYRADVLAIVQKLDIPCVDIHKRFGEVDNPLELFPLGLPGHYTVEGYGLIASVIEDVFREDTNEHPLSSPYACDAQTLK